MSIRSNLYNTSNWIRFSISWRNHNTNTGYQNSPYLIFEGNKLLLWLHDEKKKKFKILLAYFEFTAVIYHAIVEKIQLHMILQTTVYHYLTHKLARTINGYNGIGFLPTNFGYYLKFSWERLISFYNKV